MLSNTHALAVNPIYGVLCVNPLFIRTGVRHAMDNCRGEYFSLELLIRKVLDW